MSKEHPVTNNGTTNLHVGGAVIRPGETRMIEEHLVPPDLLPEQVAAPESADETDRVALQAAVGVGEITKAIPNLPDEQLDEIEANEKAGKARKTVLEAVTAERLRRAAAKAEADKAGPDGSAADKGAE